MSAIKQALLDALHSPTPRPAPPAETVRPDMSATSCGCANLRDSIRSAMEGREPAVCAEHAASATPLNDDAALAALALGTTPTQES